MYIGAYCCVSVLPYLIGLLVLGGSMRRLGLYSITSVLLVILALVVFEALNLLTGVRPLQGASSWSYPGDYLGKGVMRLAVMFVPWIGVLSPFLAARALKRRLSGENQA